MQELYNVIKKNVQKTCDILKNNESFKYPLYVIIAKDQETNEIKIMNIDHQKFMLLQMIWKLEATTKDNKLKEEELNLGLFFNYSLTKVKETQNWDILGYYFLAIGYMEDDKDVIKELKKLDAEELQEIMSDETFTMNKGLTAIIRTKDTTAALSFDLTSGELVKENFAQRSENIYEDN
jgi:hypothetical protein